MGRKRKKKGMSLKFFSHLDPETVHVIWGIVFLVLALFLGLSSMGNAGVVGGYIFNFFEMLLGVGYFLLPVFCVLVGFMFFGSLRREVTLGQILSAVLFFFSSLGLVDVFSNNNGGAIGKIISSPLLKFLDTYATVVILLALILISVVIMFNYTLSLERIMDWFEAWRERRAEAKAAKAEALEEEQEETEVSVNLPDDDEYEDEEEGEEEVEEDEEENTSKPKKGILGKMLQKDSEESMVIAPTPSLKPFVAPPLSLLSKDKGKPEVGDIKANANIIKRALQNFGINVEMDEITIGPTVTRYALKPAEGVKISRIVGLQNDLSLALAAHPLRIEAPIPGKSLVGIEIPNSSKTMVGLATLLGSSEAKTNKKPLLVALGKGISGKAHFANLAKMPHVLIAGATGSGKSVMIHTLVTSLLYRNSPETLRFIMIDPKRVELTLYKKIPHQLTPVITDPKKAILALKWAVKEMDRRYDVLEKEAVRDIQSYHKNVYEPELNKAQRKNSENDEIILPESMPYIVVIIDELADIMQSYPRELEASIVRLAQMSRAVGIHLVLSTQRPSVNVITGLIKANIPARVALQVASQIDSRTILDSAGAEKLLGAGDMLYMSGEMSKPTRIQNGYISEEELKKVVNHIANQYQDELPDEIDFTAANTGGNSIFEASMDDDDGDELYEDAHQTVLEAGKASTSYLQRKLRVGYARAARLMDMLEDRGVIGPADGSRPREVLEGSDEEEYEEEEVEGYEEGAEEESEDDETVE
jgi:DNA segregation ATPase FtsK/SpoIIIE, S-DNA-T family